MQANISKYFEALGIHVELLMLTSCFFFTFFILSLKDTTIFIIKIMTDSHKTVESGLAARLVRCNPFTVYT